MASETQAQISRLSSAVEAINCPNPSNPSIPLPVTSTTPVSLHHYPTTRTDMEATSRPIVQKISPEMKKKIQEHSYVDFHDLIFPAAIKQTLTITNPLHPQITLTPKKSQPLDTIDWALAFDLFSAAYTERFPAQAQALLSYGHRIKTYMKQSSINWAKYDVEFRKQIEIDAARNVQPVWEAMKMDLYVECHTFPAATHTQRRPFLAQSNRPSYPYQARTYGSCFAYNNQGEKCTTSSCRWKHLCTKCDQSHPQYLHPKYHKRHDKDRRRGRSPKAIELAPTDTSRSQSAKEDASSSRR